MKQFQKANLRPFPCLNVLTFLYLVDIQPNSNLHPPPHQNFLDPLLIFSNFKRNYWENYNETTIYENRTS